MIYVLLALVLFCASVMSHVFFCRGTTKSGLQAKAYVFIAVLFLGVYAWGASIIEQTGLWQAQSFWGLPFRITAGIIFVLLVPAYLCFYVLTQLTSPSKKILLSISRRGALTHADIVFCIEQEDFINTRLKDLETSGCVKQVDGCYRLSPSGQKIDRILNMVQRISGRDIGG